LVRRKTFLTTEAQKTQRKAEEISSNRFYVPLGLCFSVLSVPLW
jgi:hypothetical protein